MQNAMWFALIGICFVAYTVAVYEHGGNMRVKRYWVPAITTPKVDMVTPARFSVETSPATGVIALPPIELSYVSSGNTAVIDLPDFVPSLDVPVVTGMVMTAVSPEQQLTNALAEIARLNEALQATDAQLTREKRLHAVWLRNARIARSRFNKTVAITFEAARRPSCDKALAIVTDIGSVRKPETVHLFTPQRKAHWQEIGLVAA